MSNNISFYCASPIQNHVEYIRSLRTKMYLLEANATPKNTDTISLRLIHEVIVLLYLLIRPIRRQPSTSYTASCSKTTKNTRNTNQLITDNNLVLNVLC